MLIKLKRAGRPDLGYDRKARNFNASNREQDDGENYPTYLLRNLITNDPRTWDVIEIGRKIELNDREARVKVLRRLARVFCKKRDDHWLIFADGEGQAYLDDVQWYCLADIYDS